VEPIACRIIVAVGVYRIGQVVWALMCVDCEHHQCQLELIRYTTGNQCNSLRAGCT